ncbi:MAG: integrin alpha, partial [Pseudomonadota bacterium]|nr:integrin alpha [Pseudomonadota bacterium]
MDGCTVWAVEMGVDFDPDEAPSISELWLTLDGVTGAGADCSLTIHQEGVCGTGFYDFQNEDASWVTINTDDCPGVSGSDEGEFGAASGYLRIETIETDDLEMTQSGDPLGLTLAGYVTAVNTNLSISGAFAFSLTAPTTDVDGTPFCVVGDGDSDGDSYLDPYFGGDDCDGADASVSPGEAEDCSTMRDDNCDGNTNEECVLAYGSLSTATQYTGEAANDFAGWSVSGAGDVNGDGYDDMLVGALYNSDGPGSYAGAAYLLLGSAAPASASLSTAIQYTGEAANDTAGSSVSGAGDVNGDGYDDVLVGGMKNDDGGTFA